jgi:hypothetical protein
MNDIKIKLDNFMIAMEYIKAHSVAEQVTVNSLSHGSGIEIEFTDKANKSCRVTIFAGNITPEATSTAKIYRK